MKTKIKKAAIWLLAHFIYAAVFVSIIWMVEGALNEFRAKTSIAMLAGYLTFNWGDRIAAWSVSKLSKGAACR